MDGLLLPSIYAIAAAERAQEAIDNAHAPIERTAFAGSGIDYSSCDTTAR
jgi:hypothetical protein